MRDIFVSGVELRQWLPKRSHAALRGGPTLIYLIPEALLHLHLTPNTHCTTQTCVYERVWRARAFFFYLGQGMLESACFCFHTDKRGRCRCVFRGREGRLRWRLNTPITPIARADPPRTHTYRHVHTHTRTHTNTSFNYWFIGWGKVPVRGEDGRYRISNGPGMKRFLIFRLAAFQWTGALTGAQALIPAPGSIIGVSCRSPRPPQSTPIMRAPVPHTHTHTHTPWGHPTCVCVW